MLLSYFMTYHIFKPTVCTLNFLIVSLKQHVGIAGRRSTHWIEHDNYMYNIMQLTLVVYFFTTIL